MENGQMAEISEAQIQPFSLQVAGHDGVLAVEGDRMVIKPLSKREQLFYEGAASHPKFKAFLPDYYGTLQRGVASEEEKGVEGEMYICLENVAGGFRKACVMDIKVGTRLYDDDATEEKRQRMEHKAHETTTATLGVRVCGMLVHGHPAASRDWCRGLTESTISDALATFFAAAKSEVSAGYRQFIIRQFIVELEEYLQVVEESETRMYASSLLFVYDADKQRYQAFLGGDADFKASSGEESDGDDDEKSDALLDMRAIDFAHSHWTPGKGQDECYLFGLRKLIELFRGIMGN
ncbi:SAICAR synthase-like protein [Martensiomyces pterosporus]|nr:SAICAR synthase-like protein [Martensiomyces pterosporus]